MAFAQHEYVGTTTRTSSGPIIAYEEVERNTLAFTASSSAISSSAPEPRHCWYSCVDVYTTHTSGVTYYTAYGTITPSAVSSLVGIYINGVDSEDISNVGTYIFGTGTSCFYESADGAGDYTPILDGYDFTPSTETATGALGYMSFSASEAEPEPDPPEKATNPSPTNEATGASLSQATITWTAGVGADYEKVYCGPCDSLVLKDGHNTDESYSLASYVPFDYGETFCWRIDSVNDDGTTTGDTWSFTTYSFAPPTIANSAIKNRKKLLVAMAENRFWYEDI